MRIVLKGCSRHVAHGDALATDDYGMRTCLVSKLDIWGRARDFTMLRNPEWEDKNLYKGGKVEFADRTMGRGLSGLVGKRSLSWRADEA